MRTDAEAGTLDALDPGSVSQLGIGLDIGGTSTKAGVVDSGGDAIASVSVPSARGVDGVLQSAVAAARLVADRAGIELDAADAVGVGIPGFVDPWRGTVHH